MPSFLLGLRRWLRINLVSATQAGRHGTDSLGHLCFLGRSARAHWPGLTLLGFPEPGELTGCCGCRRVTCNAGSVLQRDLPLWTQEKPNKGLKVVLWILLYSHLTAVISQDH